MSGPAELSIAAGVLLDAGLKAAVVLGVAGVTTRLLARRSAAERHAVWSVAFAALPVLIVAAAWRGPDIAVDAPWVVGIWAVGALVALGPLVRGLVGLRHLRHTASADPMRPGVLQTDAVSSPITWGLLRPVIVLPTAASDWSEVHRTAALAHERAHIARRDWAVHMASWLVCAVFWFQPFVWVARGALAREAEHAADDHVLSSGIQPSDYASLLVSLGRLDAPRAALGVGTSTVAVRVLAVLAARPRSARRWPIALLALALMVASVPALGGSPLWSVPEEALTCAPFEAPYEAAYEAPYEAPYEGLFP